MTRREKLSKIDEELRDILGHRKVGAYLAKYDGYVEGTPEFKAKAISWYVLASNLYRLQPLTPLNESQNKIIMASRAVLERYNIKLNTEIYNLE